MPTNEVPNLTSWFRNRFPEASWLPSSLYNTAVMLDSTRDHIPNKPISARGKGRLSWQRSEIKTH